MNEFLNWLKNFFGGVAHIFFTFISEAIPLEKQIILNDLAPLARQIVADLNNQNLTWQEKRDLALTQMLAALANLGKDVAISLINLAIELAVQEMHTRNTGNAGNLTGGVQTNAS